MSLAWIPLITALPIIVFGLIVAFDGLQEQQNFEDFCEQKGFQSNISKLVGFGSSKDYCVDSNAKLTEVICDTKNCYFLQEKVK